MSGLRRLSVPFAAEHSEWVGDKLGVLHAATDQKIKKRGEEREHTARTRAAQHRRPPAHTTAQPLLDPSQRPAQSPDSIRPR